MRIIILDFGSGNIINQKFKIKNGGNNMFVFLALVFIIFNSYMLAIGGFNIFSMIGLIGGFTLFFIEIIKSEN